MTTYSDRLAVLRRFLAQNQGQPVERWEIPAASETQERWLVNGLDIVVRIHADGSWRAYLPAGGVPTSSSQILDLERALLGRREDLDLLIGLGNVARLFMDRLRELPGCTDPGCAEPACKDKRDTQAAIERLLARLYPTSQEKAS